MQCQRSAIRVFCASLLLASACSAPTYDLVISNGRVMDPESGFDRVAHVGIAGNRIEAISVAHEPIARGGIHIDIDRNIEAE